MTAATTNVTVTTQQGQVSANRDANSCENINASPTCTTTNGA
jgi:hypothetical protein